MAGLTARLKAAIDMWLWLNCEWYRRREMRRNRTIVMMELEPHDVAMLRVRNQR